MRRPRRRALAAGWLGLAAAAGAFAAGEIAPGAYCPLPQPGEKPACLDPARSRYGDFFGAVEQGQVGDAALGRVESDLASGGDSETGYLALSSLSYGYYLLSQRAASTPGEDPEIVARLERWNALLARAYERSADDARYRAAVREAAVDIGERAPRVRLSCVDAQGEPGECDSTEAVIRGFNATDEQIGILGGLERLLRRFTGGDGS